MGSVDTSLYEFSEQEIGAVRNKFPKLTLKSPGVWEGEIDIDAVHDTQRIVDRFTVLIIAPSTYPEELPLLLEMGGRTRAIVEKYKLRDARDLHYNPRTGVACLCVKQEESKKFPPGSNLVQFIESLVVPYLFGLSNYDKRGVWPWGEYSHGGLGLLESYAENQESFNKEDIERVAGSFRADDKWKAYSKQLQKPNGKRVCLCGSGQLFENCHPVAWSGVKRLNAELKRLGLNPYKLYRR